MKKYVWVFLSIILLAAAFAGCAAPASTEATPTPAPTPSEVTIAPSPSPDTSAASGGDEKEETKKEKTYKDWAYYLDEKDTIAVDYDEDPPLCRKEKEAESGKALNVRGFKFDIIGDYIYIDSLDPDLDASSVRTWSTTRLNPDGTGIKRLEFGSMSARLVPEGAQKFYFTTAGDNALYISDFACENVQTLMIALPDAKELEKKLDGEKTLQLDIESVKDGKIEFKATYATHAGIELYNGIYTITEDGKKIDKVKGTYIDNSQEREAD